VSTTTRSDAVSARPVRYRRGWYSRAAVAATATLAVAGLTAWDARVAGGVLLGGLAVDVYRHVRRSAS
jgi:hypothetical protein